MFLDKTIHRAFIIHKTRVKTKPIREFFYFHYLPKLYFGFNHWVYNDFYPYIPNEYKITVRCSSKQI